MSRRVVVVSAGLSQPSATRLLGDLLATATVDALLESGVEAQVEVIDLRELAHDLTNTLLAGFPTGGVRGALDTLAGADALVAVTPVYQGSYSGLFKTFFDVVDRDVLRGTPVVLAATGSGNTIIQPAGLTNASGVATGTISSTVAGTKTVSATAAGVAITQTAAVTVNPAAAAQLAFTVEPGTTVAGAAFSPAVEVAAWDAFGNIATGFTGTVTVAIGTNPSGSGVLDGTASGAAVLGVASFPGLNIDEAAEALGVSPATVEREWALAKAWLYRRLSSRA